MSETIALAAMVLFGVVAGRWLRRSWQAKAGAGRRDKTLGWFAFVCACIAASLVFGVMRGLFIALTLAPVGVLCVVAAGAVRREARRAARSGSLAPEPLERQASWWRSTLRWLLAGPIGMIAAMGVGIFWSTWTGGSEQTRLVIGGMLVPVVWGAAMAWTLADNRILRATAVLVGVTVLSFGLSIAKGFG